MQENGKKENANMQKNGIIKNSSAWKVTCSREKSMIKCWNGKKI